MFVQITLSALFLVAALIEMTLLVAKSYLLGERRTQAIEAQIREAQDGLQKTMPLIAERRKRLRDAHEESERIVEGTRTVDKEVAAKQRVAPILVHAVGQPTGEVRMRARVTKTVSDPNDRNQVLIWGHDNYVEVWTADAQDARAAALRQFAPEAGYKVEDFVRLDAPAPPPVAAVPVEKAA